MTTFIPILLLALAAVFTLDDPLTAAAAIAGVLLIAWHCRPNRPRPHRPPKYTARWYRPNPIIRRRKFYAPPAR